jgi:hypothetical protein
MLAFLRPILVATLLTSGAYSQTKAHSKAVTCKNGDDVRTVALQVADTASCEVTYSKKGIQQTIASAQYETEYCDSAYAKVLASLQGAGFSCR